MDKSTLNNYGWIVIVTLVLSVMLALATPFGSYVARGASNVIKMFVQSSDNAVDEDNIDTKSEDWDIYLNTDANNHNVVVPDGGKYVDANGNEYEKGDNFPEPQDDDTYTYGDYIYTLKKDDGWAVKVIDTDKNTYGIPLTKINDQPVTIFRGTFVYCKNLTHFDEGWKLPDTTRLLHGTFSGCSSLTSMPNSFTIPKSATYISTMFNGCTALSGTIVINGTFDDISQYRNVFTGTTKPITITGTTPYLSEIAAGAPNGNVTVA